MDVLTDILQSLHLKAGVYFRCEFSAPWGMEIRPTPVAEFHVVTRGSCWLRLASRRNPIPLQGGDVVVFPHGEAHALVDAPDRKAAPAESIVGNRSLEHYGPVVYGGDGVPAHVLCGYFEFDRESRHPLVAALPSLIHIRGADAEEFAWLQTVIRFIAHETRDARPGSDAVVSRLAEVLFIQILRAYVQRADAPAGFLAALAHKHIGEALAQMHGAPEKPWSVAALGARAALSRSAFAARFTQLVGRPPMEYLSALRMAKARALLADARSSTAAVAEQVGYRSEAAFSKTFKKMTGTGPGAYRRRALGRT